MWFSIKPFCTSSIFAFCITYSPSSSVFCLLGFFQFSKKKMPPILKSMVMVLIASYLFPSFLNFFFKGENCDPEKVLSLEYLLINALLILITVFILWKKHFTPLKINYKIIVLLSTFMIYLDFYYFWFSYWAFYPGNW